MSQDFGIIFCGEDLDCSESDFWKELLGIVKQSASIQCSIFVHEKENLLFFRLNKTEIVVKSKQF